MSHAPHGNEIVICGYDMVSPLGVQLEEQWAAFTSGKSGIDWVRRFELRDTDLVKVSGEVPRLTYESFDFWNERDTGNWFSPVIFHSMLVAKRSLLHAGLKIDAGNARRIAITFSSAIGGLDAMIDAETKMSAGLSPHPFTNPNGCLNLVAGKVSILTGAQGPIFSPVAACATGATSVATAALLLRTGQADAVLAGACDFPVLRSLLGSFASMNGAFRSFDKPSDRAHRDPTKVSRPFSVDRKGFVVSEGAAAFVVTTRAYADQHHLPVRAVIKGIGMTSDAKHYVAPNLPTIVAAMQKAIGDSGLEPKHIDAVNAHAASTGVGDQCETEALWTVFGKDKVPPVTANKSQIGHTMGASSAIELVLTIESLASQCALPTLNHEPDPKLDPLPVIAATRPLEQRHVLSNAFGFGGCNCCLVVGR
ncbi:MAG: beta-ketoacyl-[acyl-carrier-protein] synthase family protein [Myxococcota bacterium]|jgi:3-oxoacyl-[acyl-carrier-protein] synthase II|nr:beta-ketoacyl-[acyl-carrier-protein] synthase family protein [Myxococcota bacterium]